MENQNNNPEPKQKCYNINPNYKGPAFTPDPKQTNVVALKAEDPVMLLSGDVKNIIEIGGSGFEVLAVIGTAVGTEQYTLVGFKVNDAQTAAHYKEVFSQIEELFKENFMRVLEGAKN